MKPEAYTCCKCGYQSQHKNHFRNHLNRKTPCRPLVNDMDLTPEIITHLLERRVYRIKKEKEPPKEKEPKKKKEPKITSQQNVAHIDVQNNDMSTNTHQNILNIFLTMDPQTQVTKHLQTIKSELLPINDCISSRYQKEREDMDENRGNFLFTYEDFINMIDEATKTVDKTQFKDCNFIHDQESSKFICYNEDDEKPRPEWASMNKKKSTTCILAIVQKEYWRNYECYLIRNYENNKGNGKLDGLDGLEGLEELEVINKHIEYYYRFIACFDLQPWVYEAENDSMITVNSVEDDYGDPRSGNRIKNKYMLKYEKIKNTIIEEVKIAFTLCVQTIVGNNGCSNYEYFSTAISALFVKDPKYTNAFDGIVKKDVKRT